MNELTIKDVKPYVQKCIRHLKRKKYELNLPKDATKKAVKSLKMSSGRRSRAGSNSIKISKTSSFSRLTLGRFKEYDRYASDPVIGTVDIKSIDEAVFILVAHEVSHYIQYTYRGTYANWLNERQKTDRGHGECFRTIYRFLRADFVNPKILAKRK